MTSRRFETVIGTGGIGSGIAMRLEGDHSLGREESRAVTLIDTKDYCKLHIVLHYVQRLLGLTFPVVPIGAVGNDEAGRAVLEELAQVGMQCDHVRTIPGESTLFAVSFSYPNGDGGNLTTLRSASDLVTSDDILVALKQVTATTGIAVALPEVPLSTRTQLLRQSRGRFFRVASFISGEVEKVLESGLLTDVDLIALNADEARAFSGSDADDPEEIAERAVETLLTHNEHLQIIVTAGKNGSWSWDGATLTHARTSATVVVGTAGAGDSHLGAIVTALVSGATLHEANSFGAIVSAMKVASRDAINHDIDAHAVLAEAGRLGVQLPASLCETLRNVAEKIQR